MGRSLTLRKCVAIMVGLIAALPSCAITLRPSDRVENLGSTARSRSASAQEPGPYLQLELGQHTAAIRSLAVDQAGLWLVTASDDKTARVWELSTGRLARILRPPIGNGNEGRLYAIAISPDGTRVVVGGFTGPDNSGRYPIYLFERESGRLIAHSADFASATLHLAFSPDGNRVAATFGPGVGMRLLRAADLTDLAGDDDCQDYGSGADFDPAGRLVTACFDGVLRLYDSLGRRLAKRRVEGGTRPLGVRFSPDGAHAAVGFHDSSAVTIVSGRDLSRLYVADTRFADNGSLSSVAWSRDGQRLLAAGRFGHRGSYPIAVWPQGGRGTPTLHDAASETILDLAALPNGRVVFAAAGPDWGVLGPTGSRERLVLPVGLDHRGSREKFRIAPDGRRVEFAFNVWDGQQWSRTLARFDLDQRTLARDVSTEADLTAPRTTGMPVANWENNLGPTFNGRPLTGLQQLERSRVLAIARDASRFVLGTEWWLRSFDARGTQSWRQRIPATAWAVNVTDDGRFVIAALGDGTIRWYDAATGREQLALFVHARDGRWVLWTPEGFSDAVPGGDALFGYHLNQGLAHAGEFIDNSQLAAMMYRPDLITRRLNGDEPALEAAVRQIGDVRTVLAAGLPPQIELLSPAVVETDGDYELRVRVTPASGGAGPLRVRINGVQIATRGAAPPGGGIVTERLSLAPGQNNIGVAAVTLNGKVASSDVRAIVTVKPPTGLPTLRVLAVGISQYIDASFRDGVRFAAADATAVVKHLRAGARGVYRDVDAVLLTSPENTRLAQLTDALTALAYRARPEDVVVIFLAGHGKAHEGEYHFIPSDFLYTNDHSYARGGTLAHATLEALLKNLGAGKRLLILDTCHSGAAIRARSNDEKDALARLMRSSGRYILAAASPIGKALEDGRNGHGIYTHALMEGLAGKAERNGRIEVDELAAYLQRRVPELTQPYGYQQIPMRSATGHGFWITLPAPMP